MLFIQFITWLSIFFQDDIPPIYSEFLNLGTIANVLVIVGGVKLIRNIVNLKGIAAVILTIVASFAYGLLQFGLTDGILHGVILSALAAGSFYITKNVGAVMSVYGVGNFPKIIPDVLRFIKEHPELMKKLWFGLRFLLLRK